jgi:hypothetical protein
MNKYRHYKCDTCLKETDIENNLTHAFIDKCTLTTGCTGTLRFVEERNYKQNILNFPSALQSSTIGTYLNDTTLPEYLDASSSGENSVVAVVPTSLQSQSNSVLTVNFSEILNTEQAYTEYTYSLNVPVNVISGKDSSINQRVLTFGANDTVIVFINGVELGADQFTASSNVIRFTNQITYATYSTTQVFARVLVYTKQPISYKSLSFKRNVSGSSSGLWSNVSSMTMNGDKFDLFTCEDLSNLDLNTRLTVDSAQLDGKTIDKSIAYFLLAQEPFHPIDRIVSQVVKLDTLNDDVNHLLYKIISKVPRILVTAASLKDIFPPITPRVIFSAIVEFASDTAAAEDTSLNLNIRHTNQIILGPV